MNRQPLVVPLLAVVALTIGACSSPVGGTPNPATTSQSGDSGGSTSSSNSTSADPLASVNPCSLLTTTQLNQYQLQQSQADTENGARTCSWQGAVGTGQNGGEVDIDIWDRAGVNLLSTDGYSITNYPVGKHQGRLVQSNDGGGLCAVSIAITNTSRVDVQGNGLTGDQSISCAVAKQFAPMVEQNLVALGD